MQEVSNTLKIASILALALLFVLLASLFVLLASLFALPTRLLGELDLAATLLVALRVVELKVLADDAVLSRERNRVKFEVAEASFALRIGREAFANSALGESGAFAVGSIIVDESKGLQLARAEVAPLGANLDGVLLPDVALVINLSVKLPEDSPASNSASFKFFSCRFDTADSVGARRLLPLLPRVRSDSFGSPGLHSGVQEKDGSEHKSGSKLHQI